MTLTGGQHGAQLLTEQDYRLHYSSRHFFYSNIYKHASDNEYKKTMTFL